MLMLSVILNSLFITHNVIFMEAVIIKIDNAEAPNKTY